MATSAPAPTRRTTQGTLSFGIISIPIDVFAGEVGDPTKVKRSLRSVATGNPIGYLNVDKVTGEEVVRAEQYKVFVFEDETEVPLTDEEILDVLSPVKGAATIVAFVPDIAARELHAVKHFQVRPHRPKSPKSVDPGVLKAWTLLTDAMATRGAAAVVRLAMRDRASFYTLFSDGHMAEVLPAQAVRAELDRLTTSTSEAEQELALQLLDAAWEDDVPELFDDSKERVEEFAADKLAGKEFRVPSAGPSTSTTDLIEALSRSIKEAEEAKVDA